MPLILFFQLCEILPILKNPAEILSSMGNLPWLFPIPYQSDQLLLPPPWTLDILLFMCCSYFVIFNCGLCVSSRLWAPDKPKPAHHHRVPGHPILAPSPPISPLKSNWWDFACNTESLPASPGRKKRCSGPGRGNGGPSKVGTGGTKNGGWMKRANLTALGRVHNTRKQHWWTCQNSFLTLLKEKRKGWDHQMGAPEVVRMWRPLDKLREHQWKERYIEPAFYSVILGWAIVDGLCSMCWWADDQTIKCSQL